MNMKLLVAAIVVIVVLVGGFALSPKKGSDVPLLITSFDECAAKYPVLESYPEQCNTPDGKHFVREISVATSTPITPVTPPTSSRKEFGRAVSLSVNDQVTFADGLVVGLRKIDDSRCPANVQCVWQGELAPTLAISQSQDDSTRTEEIRLGTVNNNTVTAKGYQFVLQGATETTATIVVTKATVTSTGGAIR